MTRTTRTTRTTRQLRTDRLLRIAPAAALLALVMLPTPASAHGIGGDAADASVLGFVPIGIEHMLAGWDHLLFVAGVVLVAREPRLAAKLISLFVLGHSTTLIAATLAGWQVNADAVDVVIALSVVVVAGVGILGRPERFRLFGAAVLGFGLIHGLGLATRLQDLGLPEQGRLWRVIAFNIGIEIGQLTAVFGFAVILMIVVTYLDPAKHARAAQLACAPMFIGGSVAASLIALDAFNAVPEAPEVELADDTSCQIASPTKPLGDGTGDHPDQQFYGPDQATPINDFGHSLGDGYVLVLYPDTATAQDVEALRAYVENPETEGVLAGPAAIDEVRVLQMRDTMTCTDFELDSIRIFSDTWIAEVLG